MDSNKSLPSISPPCRFMYTLAQPAHHSISQFMVCFPQTNHAWLLNIVCLEWMKLSFWFSDVILSQELEFVVPTHADTTCCTVFPWTTCEKPMLQLCPMLTSFIYDFGMALARGATIAWDSPPNGLRLLTLSSNGPGHLLPSRMNRNECAKDRKYLGNLL